MITDWDANNYERFATARQRPAWDLLQAIPEYPVQSITDLGCGSGLSTELLLRRWPNAQILGVDQSPDMLRRARERLATTAFVEADIARYEPPQSQDLLFANASLHWLSDQRTLLATLLGQLAPGGHLAVQMPNNLDEPSHRLMRRIAAREPYAAYLKNAVGIRQTLLQAEEYYDCLTLNGASVSLWETRYLHVLDDARSIRDWYSSTGLKPYLDALTETLRVSFLAEYDTALGKAYPAQSDGTVLLAMPRLFILARREN